MKKVQIQFNENMSKAEELQAWEAFYNNLPEGSYLQLTLKGLDVMVKSNIENDFGINAAETMEQQAARITELQAKENTLTNKLEMAEEVYETRVKQLKDSIDALQAELDRVRYNWEQTEGTLDAANKAWGQEQETTKAQALEIQALKAKLYDLMVKGE